MFAAWDPKPELSYLTSLANLPLQLVLLGLTKTVCITVSADKRLIVG